MEPSGHDGGSDHRRADGKIHAAGRDDEAYAEGTIKAVVCTNLIYRSEDVLNREWYLDADMVPYVARIIDGLNVDESIYDLINSTSRLSEFAKQMRLGEIFDEFNE